LSATASDVIADWLRPGQHGDLADLFHRLSIEGKLAGYEVSERFYEIGSPGGLRELEDHLRERAP
jgi:NDP-sugar pyrophosphorylase family protein